MPLLVDPQRTTRDQAMQMHMLSEIIAPGMQHGSHAELAVEVFGFHREGFEGALCALVLICTE